MRKGLKYILYPLAIVIVILAFLHLSYTIDYKNIDEIYIGLILLLLSNLICVYYLYNYSKKKEMEYIILSISFILWLFLLLQNLFEIFVISNQKNLLIFAIIYFIFLLLPTIIGLIHYIKVIKNSFYI